MIPRSKIIAFYLLAILFIVFDCYLIAIKDIMLLNLAPIAIIVFYGLFYSFDKLFLASVFFVPISFPLERYFPSLGFNLALPTEPIFICILFIFILQQLKERSFDIKILKHPLSAAIIFYLLWRLITIITSTMPIISIKYFVMLLWFIIPFYFLMTQIVRNPKNINKFLWVYIIGFCVIIAYTLVRHSQYGFSQRFANHIMRPYFNDHTSYGALLAMYIPVLIGFIINKDLKKKVRIFSSVILTYFIVAIIFSYTRAAWVSLIGAFVVFIALKLRINYKAIIAFSVIALGLFFSFQEQIFIRLEDNEQDSSNNITEHVKSITNVATDASNLERINRWNCALRMYKEKPVFGWGPGTYQFQYAPFQYSYEKTIVSTNTGNLGNAHSEYLGSLSESGLLGMISYIIVIVIMFVTAVRVYSRASSKSIRILASSLICGLVTYFIHSFLNNFLDIDKMAVPFWGFAAILVAIDVYYLPTQTCKENKTEIIYKD